MSAHVQPLLNAPESDNRLGALLVRNGKLKSEDLARISEKQKRDGSKFGQAAISLGLVSEVDILQALAAQFNFPGFAATEERISSTVVAACQPFTTEVEQLRYLRSHLLQHMKSEPGCRVFAITSVSDAEGRSWLAANLAVLFSQLSKRTILIDCNFRSPQQGLLFGVRESRGLSSYLSQRNNSLEQLVPISGLEFTLVPAGVAAPNPQELFNTNRFSELIAQARSKYEVVILDCAAAKNGADSLSLAAMADGCVLAQRRDLSQIRDSTIYCEQLKGAGARILGSVLCDG